MSSPVPHGTTVLVVEDDEVNRALLRAILAPGAHRLPGPTAIVEAESLADARSALAETRVDVVLLDVRLPDGNGLDLARDLATLTSRPRIVVLSASVLPAERQAALDAGCDAFLGKPFVPRDLLELLDDLLR
jgi:two-component system KDP operon response regulator KdpE